MKIRYIYFSIMIFIFLAYNSFSDEYIDSLEKELKVIENDTTKIEIFNNLSQSYFNVDPQKGIEYATKSVALSKKLDRNEDLADSYSMLGLNYLVFGDYQASADYYYKSLLIYEELDSQTDIADCSGNLGMLYSMLEDNDKAVNYFDRAYDIYKADGNEVGITNVLIHKGNINVNTGMAAKGIEFYLEALDLSTKINDDFLHGNVLGNLANAYLETGELDKALDYFDQTYKKYSELGDQRQIVYTLFNYSILYHKKAQKGNNKYFISKALDYAHKAESSAEKISLGELSYQIYEKLAQLYKEKGKLSKAYDYFEKFHNAKESVIDRNKAEEIGKIQAKYELEKEQIEEDIKREAEERKIQEELVYRNNIQYLSVTLIIIVLFISIFLIPRMKYSNLLLDGIVLVTFLLFYELLLIIAEPWVEDISNNVPIVKLLINCSLALTFIPIHRLEMRLRKKYSKKKQN
jgi:tetratricopeptide (TPR) repeat protein